LRYILTPLRDHSIADESPGFYPAFFQMPPETDIPLPEVIAFQEVSVAETAGPVRAIIPFD